MRNAVWRFLLSLATFELRHSTKRKVLDLHPPVRACSTPRPSRLAAHEAGERRGGRLRLAGGGEGAEVVQQGAILESALQRSSSVSKREGSPSCGHYEKGCLSRAEDL